MNYFDWRSIREGAGKPYRRRRTDEVDREEPAKPSEPIEVQEFEGASTTVIERVRDAIRKRFTGP